MASYLNQPDAANICCDCPSRESPCDNCSTCLPEGDCGHYVQFEVKFDSTETSVVGDHEVIRFYSTGTSPDFGRQISIEADSAGEQWTASDSYTVLIIPFTDAPFTPDVWHQIIFAFTGDGSGGFTSKFCVNGVEALLLGGGTGDTAGVTYNKFRLGSTFGGTFHRSYRNVTYSTNFDDDTGDLNTFDFTGDSFDSFTGTTSVVGDELRIDDTSAAYAEKTLYPGWNLACTAYVFCSDDGTDLTLYFTEATTTFTIHYSFDCLAYSAHTVALGDTSYLIAGHTCGDFCDFFVTNP